MTIHSMGGAMKNEPVGGRAFAFRDTEVLLQFQSWWNYPNEEKQESCQEYMKKCQQDYIDWVTKLRGLLQKEELVEGAFINFVDKDIPLKEYYARNFERLQKIKGKYDPNNVFKFEMGIPGRTS